MTIKNKNVVIIGGTVGIGGAITRRLAREGCNILATYYGKNEKKEAEKLAIELKKHEIKYFLKDLDILKKDEIISFFKYVKEVLPSIDVAINNAGVNHKNNFLDIDEDEWDLIMDTNAKGNFFCCQEEVKIMVKQNYGKIINTSSLAGKLGGVFQTHYSASKFAVLGFTFSMAKELAKFNITVNAVCPGFILTDMSEREWHREAKLRNMDRSDVINNTVNRIPLNRFGTSDDVANIFLFLASEDSNYITGQAFNVDGGVANY